MTESRYGPSATLLLDGRVLIAGGNNSRTAEVFDPRTGAFSRVGDMTAVHGNGHTATRLPSGEVLIVGGFGETAFPVATAELFDPRTNTFRSLGNTLEARRAHVAVLLPNGSVLIRGGFTLEGPTATVERFDPATGRFVREPDMALAVGDNTAVYLAVSAGPKPWPRIDQTLAVNERGVFAPDNRYSVSVEQVELTGAEVRVFIDAQGPADLRDPVTSCIIELGASSATGEKAQRFVSTITEPGRRYKGYLVFRRDFLEYGKQYLLRYSCLPDYSAAALGRIY
jgi:hypothetical protein